MKEKTYKTTKLFFLIGWIALIGSSCTTIKNVKYFADLPDSSRAVKLENVVFTEPRIQPDDILAITFALTDPQASQILNQGNVQTSAVGASSTGTGGQTVSGILVDKSGYVELPVLGKVKVAGLTTEQARELIRTKAEVDYKGVSVNVRFANFRITILGEVAKPATYVVPNEKITILDALGLAGDLTIYGKRDDVRLIRTYDDGTRETVTLDLTKSDVLNSKYYYLRQGDYIYVEPIKSKIAASDAIQNRNITITTTIISFLVSVLVVIIAKN